MLGFVGADGVLAVGNVDVLAGTVGMLMVERFLGIVGTVGTVGMVGTVGTVGMVGLLGKVGKVGGVGGLGNLNPTVDPEKER